MEHIRETIKTVFIDIQSRYMGDNMKDKNIIELLFVDSSSRDRRGRRVLVRDDSGCENWIWAEDGVTQIDMDLLGITASHKIQIDRFFAGTGQPVMAQEPPPGAVG